MIKPWQVILVLLLLTFTGCARKNFFAETPVVDPTVYAKLQESPEGIDSVVVKAGKHYKRGWLHRLFWGQHNRPIWASPVKVPVFDMDTVQGGLEIEELGGGFQTTSLTLVGKDGFTYALRSIDKDPREVLPKGLRKTFMTNVLRDQISAINPYGAFVIPPLAEAAGIYHSNPRLVYVRPNDTDFGEYTDTFSDNLFMLEEKFDDEHTITPMLGNAVDIDGSGTVLENRFSENDHFIDETAFAKARLLDILVNDWDRHEGQWEWAVYEEDGEKIYRPIPEDRDNVFYRGQDGIIPWLLTRNWGIRKFESFDKEINDVKALTVNSEFIDKRALSQVTRQQFDSLAKELQVALTDEVIDRAVRQFPDSVYNLIGERTERSLISRRDMLDEAAAKFYEILAKEVLVVGTNQEDKFEVKRLDDERTEVVVRRQSDDKVYYRRTFYRPETELITLRGLAGEDEFEISGDVQRGIKVEVYGGRGEDEIKDTSRVRRGGKKTWVYDTKRGTELEKSRETKDKRTNDIRVHAFDWEGF